MSNWGGLRSDASLAGVTSRQPCATSRCAWLRAIAVAAQRLAMRNVLAVEEHLGAVIEPAQQAGVQVLCVARSVWRWQRAVASGGQQPAMGAAAVVDAGTARVQGHQPVVNGSTAPPAIAEPRSASSACDACAGCL